MVAPFYTQCPEQNCFILASFPWQQIVKRLKSYREDEADSYWNDTTISRNFCVMVCVWIFSIFLNFQSPENYQQILETYFQIWITVCEQ